MTLSENSSPTPDIVIRKFELQSCYSITFQSNNPAKGMNPLMMMMMIV